MHQPDDIYYKSILPPRKATTGVKASGVFDFRAGPSEEVLVVLDRGALAPTLRIKWYTHATVSGTASGMTALTGSGSDVSGLTLSSRNYAFIFRQGAQVKRFIGCTVSNSNSGSFAVVGIGMRNKKTPIDTAAANFTTVYRIG